MIVTVSSVPMRIKAFGTNVADAASQDELLREKPSTSPPPITAVFFRKSRRLKLILMISLIPFLLPSSSLQPCEWLCGYADMFRSGKGYLTFLYQCFHHSVSDSFLKRLLLASVVLNDNSRTVVHLHLSMPFAKDAQDRLRVPLW